MQSPCLTNAALMYHYKRGRQIEETLKESNMNDCDWREQLVRKDYCEVLKTVIKLQTIILICKGFPSPACRLGGFAGKCAKGVLLPRASLEGGVSHVSALGSSLLCLSVRGFLCVIVLNFKK